MAKITIAQLETSDSYINELSNTELDATKGGRKNVVDAVGGLLGVGVQDTNVGLVNVDDVLNESLNKSLNDNSVLSPTVVVG
ncbi:MAG: hypothetical protein ACREPR_19780 [Brasilonema sp.]